MLFVCLFVCLFVSFGVFVPLEIFSLIWRHRPYRWRAANFDLYSAFLASLRTHDTHTYFWAFGSGAVTTYFYDLALSRLIFEYPTFFLLGERSNRLYHRRGLLDFNSKYKFQCLDWTEAESNIVRRRFQKKNCSFTSSYSFIVIWLDT